MLGFYAIRCGGKPQYKLLPPLNHIKKFYAKFRVKRNIFPDFLNMGVYGAITIMITIFPILFFHILTFVQKLCFLCHLCFMGCFRQLSKFRFTKIYLLFKNAYMWLKIVYTGSSFIQLPPVNKGIIGQALFCKSKVLKIGVLPVVT